MRVYANCELCEACSAHCLYASNLTFVSSLYRELGFVFVSHKINIDKCKCHPHIPFNGAYAKLNAVRLWDASGMIPEEYHRPPIFSTHFTCSRCALPAVAVPPPQCVCVCVATLTQLLLRWMRISVYIHTVQHWTLNAMIKWNNIYTRQHLHTAYSIPAWYYILKFAENRIRQNKTKQNK